jgi:hypothetical protein
VLLKSLGSRDKVVFDPPLIINCQLVIALHRWLMQAVQPAAMEAFISPISKVVGSSYACRTTYNDPNARLSQHAFANAVDLPTFVLADGRKVNVTQAWGPTKRDLAAAKTAGVDKKIAGQQTVVSKITSTDLVKVSHPHATTDANRLDVMAVSTDQAIPAEAKFLRRAQQAACNIFTTVLGPEFNDVHRTHFHLDLQTRDSGNICK